MAMNPYNIELAETLAEWLHANTCLTAESTARLAEAMVMQHRLTVAPQYAPLNIRLGDAWSDEAISYKLEQIIHALWKACDQHGFAVISRSALPELPADERRALVNDLLDFLLAGDETGTVLAKLTEVARVLLQATVQTRQPFNTETPLMLTATERLELFWRLKDILLRVDAGGPLVQPFAPAVEPLSYEAEEERL